MLYRYACVAATVGVTTVTTAEHTLLPFSASLLCCDPLADWLVGLEVLQLALPAAVARSPASRSKSTQAAALYNVVPRCFITRSGTCGIHPCQFATGFRPELLQSER
jgi:hypothetical protein